MSAFRCQTPFCQIGCPLNISDGTLARMPSRVPSMIGSTGSKKSTPVTPASCSYLDPRSSGTVRAPQASFDRLRQNSGTPRISSTQPINIQRWRNGSSSAAEKQNITIGAQTISIIRPTNANTTGRNLPTTTQIAESLRAIPAKQCAYTSTIIISPVPHPDSTVGYTIAGDAGSGTITLFPITRRQSQNDFDNRLMHEAAHNYQGSLWNSGAAVAAWGAAANRDNRHPSPYAATNYGEDFCEFNILYNTSRNTPCEIVAKRLYPHRWAKMAQY